MKRLLMFGLVAAAVIGLTWMALPSQKALSESATTLDAFIPALMEEAAIPGLALAVIEKGRVVRLEAHGHASIERGEPVTVDTPFNIASISKPVMGIVLLQLVDRGLLDLDRPINDYLPFTIDNPKVDGDAISLRHLATHTSGIADYYDIATYSDDADSPTPLPEHLQSLLVADGDRYESGRHYRASAPGNQREYSNLGAALAGQLVEAVTGETLAEYSRHALFAPLGLQHTGWLLRDFDLHRVAVPYEVVQCVPYTAVCADTESPRGNWLIGTVFDPPIRFKQFKPYPHFGNPQYPDGGLRSSVRDLSMLTTALLTRRSSDQTLLSAQAHDEMLRLQLPSELSTSQRFFWRDDASGRPGHKGSDLGVFTYLYFDPEAGSAVIILMNRAPDGAAELAMEALSTRLWNTIGTSPATPTTASPTR